MSLRNAPALTPRSNDSDHAALVAQVYRANWAEFFEWKREDSKKALTSLLVSAPQTEGDTLDDASSDYEDESVVETASYDLDVIRSRVRITEFIIPPSSTQPTPTATTYLTPVRTRVQNQLSTYQGYSSTTLLRRSILIGDDPNPMPFLPFSDDARFNHDGFANDHYDTFSWQDNVGESKRGDVGGFSCLDPDVEVICAQSVKELLDRESKFDLEQILATDVMPKNLVRNVELYVGARRRDYPSWPPNDPLHPTNAPYHPDYTTIAQTPIQILSNLVQYFCISDCLHGYCNTHSNEQRPLPPSIPPTLTNESLYNSISTRTHLHPRTPARIADLAPQPTPVPAPSMTLTVPDFVSARFLPLPQTTTRTSVYEDGIPPRISARILQYNTVDTKLRGIVHRSTWGLGYYLLESAREGDLITEYVGDLIYELTVRSRDAVAAHTNRQYMFKLNSVLTVDGTTTGNESRYINHAPSEKANVQAHVRLVNSEHRIGIFASKDIKLGTELLLDYGSDFFHTHPSSQTQAQARTRTQVQTPKLKHTTSQSQNAHSRSNIATPPPNPISDSPLILSASFLPSPSTSPKMSSQQQRTSSPTPFPRGTKSSRNASGLEPPTVKLKSISQQPARARRPARTTRRAFISETSLQEETVPRGDEESEYNAVSGESDESSEG
ncbi:hypothetical protein NP233_g6368 [Leucocoprinus birnbaumii]|uniref:SET domain-containing protein n=1 Tax=Leucocoprinus birnbaumii TaxID=56174 RepID=A0AAD5VTY6_9AGAR|nr:hypothetical protein NP233_g6368 [Leucocoprinus birnbaumii]